MFWFVFIVFCLIFVPWLLVMVGLSFFVLFFPLLVFAGVWYGVLLLFIAIDPAGQTFGIVLGFILGILVARALMRQTSA